MTFFRVGVSLRRRKQVGMDAAAVTQFGWMLKKGEGRHNWKRRFFQLDDRTLSYSRGERDNEPVGFIDLLDCTKIASGKSMGFTDYDGHPTTLGIVLITTVRTYYFVAENELEKYQWIQVLGEHIITTAEG
mmetsp:Transcript_704/g.1728  ORF Transcript_704/g.1728 Transcript_704/m.1728 type:complete len:131 (+) Transcript_704:3-395(+)